LLQYYPLFKDFPFCLPRKSLLEKKKNSFDHPFPNHLPKSLKTKQIF